MNYTFTAIIIILLCLLTFFAAPVQNPSLKEDKIERLEFEVRVQDEKLSEMADSDEEIMEQHEQLFKALERGGNTPSGYSYN